MAQGSVSGILVQTGFVGTQSGHEEESDVFTNRRMYYDVDVVFEQKFKNVPTLTINNMKETIIESLGYDGYYTSVNKSGFTLRFEFYDSGNTFDFSFDWTATGK